MATKAEIEQFKARLEMYDYGSVVPKESKAIIENSANLTRRTVPEVAVEYMEHMNQISNDPYIRNGTVPSDYRGKGAQMTQLLRKIIMNAAGAIPDEMVYALDKVLVDVLYDSANSNAILQKYGMVRQQQGNPRWQTKFYREKQSGEWPIFTQTFRDAPRVKAGVEPAYKAGTGAALGYQMGWQELQEAENDWYDPLYMTKMQVGQKMGIFIDEWNILGQKGEHSPDATHLTGTGLFNTANLPTFEAGIGADDDITAAGDMEATIKAALADLKNVYVQAPRIIVSTANVFEQMFENKNTYQPGVTDASLTWKRFFATGLVDAWYINDRLYNAAVDATHGQMLLMIASPQIYQKQIIYPAQPLIRQPDFQGDIDEITFLGNSQYYRRVDGSGNPVGCTIAGNITCSGAGMSTNFFYGSAPVMTRTTFYEPSQKAL